MLNAKNKKIHLMWPICLIPERYLNIPVKIAYTLFGVSTQIKNVVVAFIAFALFQ